MTAEKSAPLETHRETEHAYSNDLDFDRRSTETPQQTHKGDFRMTKRVIRAAIVPTNQSCRKKTSVKTTIPGFHQHQYVLRITALLSWGQIFAQLQESIP